MRRALVGVVMVGVGGAGLLACSDDSSTGPSPTSAPATVERTSVAPTSSTASTSVPSTSASTTTSGAPPSTVAPTLPPTTVVATPPAVTEVQARPGGGSGEIAVTWRGVPGATTYRVERATAPQGPFETSGVIGTDGSVTRGEGVVNLFAAGDGTFTYVEVITTLSNAGVQRWYRVLALNAGGPSAPSRVVCGAPPGAPAC